MLFHSPQYFGTAHIGDALPRELAARNDGCAFIRNIEKLAKVDGSLGERKDLKPLFANVKP